MGSRRSSAYPGRPLVGRRGDQALASCGQSLAIVGKDSTGKTTLAHQIAKGRMGLPGCDDLLGFPLRPLPGGQRVLILACDRPQQIRAAFARGIDTEDEQLVGILRDRLVWVDLPGEVVLPSPEGTKWLLDICRSRDVGLVVVDSAKDAVDGDLRPRRWGRRMRASGRRSSAT